MRLVVVGGGASPLAFLCAVFQLNCICSNLLLKIPFSILGDRIF